MSMFYELMMIKKEQIMYATIKGTLTENDGVFSGFSASNYLQVQNSLDLTNSWEIQLEFTTGNDISSEQFILADTVNPSPLGFGIYTSSQFVVYYMNTNGQRVFAFINDLSANTKYKVNLKYSKEEHKFYVYINGVKKVDVASIYAYSNRYIRFGVSRLFTSAFIGSIDLNNSYIKLGSTKYNLQAVVGYTVVGSPTIVDGVVSGFSSANYVHILDFPNTFNSLEIVIKAKKSATGNQPIFALQNGSTAQQNFYLYMSNSACIFYYRSANDETKNISISYSVNVDVYYYFRLKISNSKIKLGYSTDGTNWVEKEVEETMLVASGMDFRFGVVLNNAWYLNGEIDMNETLIKKDNKLWFNGQQA